MSSNRSSMGRSSGRRLKNEINVVPYIDVMLVLLIIFMVTAPMITPGIIELPSVGRAAEVPTEPLEVQIEENGTVSLRKRIAGAEFESIANEALVDEVRSRITADTPVVIAADGKVPYEKVMEVMDKLRSNGVSRLGLLVDQSAGNPDQK
ncbi:MULTISPECIES: protein TolR [unclassified Pusillimonas]|uniref:protein TolR n=1 Tax=unclassified Pusillimonas TaxID=2640016 RepID=UPI000B9CD87D|nr:MULTISPECIES: protein TolR [unclassified Pusillimonas]OXR49811.1 protein TolR [Pusillimonas sp. T2]ROT43968.1 protein TolR [Pusillimonas sp. NJUB218]